MFDTVLRSGSTGPQVEYLQSVLNRLGFSVGTVDGIFGPRTERGVRRFQEKNGLTADGIVGPKTWAALRPYLTGYVERKVRSGDTFYLIAKEYGSSVASIEAANPSVDPLNLKIGQSLIIPISAMTVPTDVSYGYQLLKFNLDSFKKRYPFLQQGSMGKSVLGNDLCYVRFGRGEKELFYNAAHHANEWITSVVMMRFIEQLCNAYVNGGSIGGESAREIYDRVSLYIAPMVNPDGVDLVTGYYPKGSVPYERALKLSVAGVPFPDGWKANITGTDLNLNYPAEWEAAKQLKYALGYTSPRPFGYVGEYPFSAPESHAVGEFTKAHRFLLTLSYHTQGEIIFWKFLDYNPPESRRIGEIFAQLSGYSLEETPTNMGYAGYKDWFIQEYNRPGYTVEVGRGRNPLPIGQFDTIYADNIGILSQAPLLI